MQGRGPGRRGKRDTLIMNQSTEQIRKMQRLRTHTHAYFSMVLVDGFRHWLLCADTTTLETPSFNVVQDRMIIS